MDEYDIVFSIDGMEVDRLFCREKPDQMMVGLCGPWRPGLVAAGACPKLRILVGDDLGGFIEEYALYHANEGGDGLEGYQTSGVFDLDDDIKEAYPTSYPPCKMDWELRKNAGGVKAKPPAVQVFIGGREVFC